MHTKTHFCLLTTAKKQPQTAKCYRNTPTNPAKSCKSLITTQNKRASMTTSKHYKRHNKQIGRLPTVHKPTNKRIDADRHAADRPLTTKQTQAKTQAKQKKLKKNSDWGGGAWRWGSRGGLPLQSAKQKQKANKP